jgi:elongation factor P
VQRSIARARRGGDVGIAVASDNARDADVAIRAGTLEIHGHNPGEKIITVLGTNQFKSGNHIDVEGTVFKILEFQHVKPGKGGAFVRTKLRRASDGAVIDRTFRAGEKFRAVRTEARRMQFLYADGSEAHFMDSESFEQIAVPEDTFAEALRWLAPSREVDMLFIDDMPADLQLPSAVDLEVAQTEPGLRGDTASGGGTKPATLETGAVIQVPLFVDVGERIRVDTRSGEYLSRA